MYIHFLSIILNFWKFCLFNSWLLRPKLGCREDHPYRPRKSSFPAGTKGKCHRLLLHSAQRHASWWTFSVQLDRIAYRFLQRGNISNNNFCTIYGGKNVINVNSLQLWNGTLTGEDCFPHEWHPNVFLMSVLLSMITYSLCVTLKQMKLTPYFPYRVNSSLQFHYLMYH